MTRRQAPPVTHTHALFANQSQSILDDLVASGVELFSSVVVMRWGNSSPRRLPRATDTLEFRRTLARSRCMRSGRLVSELARPCRCLRSRGPVGEMKFARLSAGGKWIRTVGTRQISYRFRRTFVASVAVPVPERDSFLSRRGTESLNPSPSSSESGELPYCRRRLDPDRRQRLESAPYDYYPS